MKDLYKNNSLNDKIVDFVSDNIVWVFLFFIVVVIVLPRLFILASPIGYFDNLKPDELGNAIGGMTAPIIGLVSAFLIYVAFSAQVKANKELQKLNERDSNVKELNNLINLNSVIQKWISEITLEIDSKIIQQKKVGFDSICYMFNKYLSLEFEAKKSNINDHIIKSIELYDFVILVSHEIDKSLVAKEYKRYFFKQILILSKLSIHEDNYHNIKFENSIEKQSFDNYYQIFLNKVQELSKYSSIFSKKYLNH